MRAFDYFLYFDFFFLQFYELWDDWLRRLEREDVYHLQLVVGTGDWWRKHRPVKCPVSGMIPETVLQKRGKPILRNLENHNNLVNWLRRTILGVKDFRSSYRSPYDPKSSCRNDLMRYFHRQTMKILSQGHTSQLGGTCREKEPSYSKLALQSRRSYFLTWRGR